MQEKYKCLNCKHLQPGKLDILECELQEAKFITDTKWTMEPVCIYDAEAHSRMYHGNYDTSHLTNRFEQK